MIKCTREFGSPWLNVICPTIYQMVNDRMGLAVFFIVLSVILTPTIIGPFLIYLIVLIHGFSLSSKLK